MDMVVTAVNDDGTFEATFYGGYPVANGRLNVDWDAVHFAFTSEDGSGVYHTRGELRGGRLTGTTHSLGREFHAVWRGSKAD